MNRTLLVTIGFLSFVLGILSMILKLCGMQFIFMRFVQHLFGSYTFVVYLILCLVGFMMAYIGMDSTRQNTLREEEGSARNLKS